MFNHLSLNQEIIYEYLISYKNIPNTSELYGPGVLTRFIKETGVYAIYFPKTNEVYFGSTQDLFTRRERHLYRLRAQQHRNKKVQIAFNESGINNILFLYHRTSSREEAYFIEQRLIDSYIDSGLLLNRSLDVYSSFRGLKGLERDAETRKNISIAAKLAYIKHPDKRSKVSVSKKKYYEDNPQVIKRISETTKKQWSNPETRGLLVKNALPNLAKGIESTSKPIVVDGVIYPSSAEAGRVLGVSCPLFRLRSPNFPNWNYLSDIEKTMNNEDKKETTVSQQLNKDTLLKKIHQGMVVYCDGGSRSGTNKGGPGYGGFGIHGYLYKDDDVKKEAGNPDHVLTVGGYVSKKDYNADPTSYIKVEPLHYIDGVGSFGNLVTNNYAELHAAINTLRHALDYDIVRILIVGDSQYVIKGMNEYAETWRANHWRKGDGEEVKNVDLWKELVMLRDQLQQRGVEVTFQWVKAHHDELGNVGNVIADKYATIGVMTSIGGVVRIEIDTTPASGYWKNDLSKHPLLCLPRMYFNTAADTIRSGEYYLGNHGKEDDMLGKRISDGCYAVVRLKENDKVLDTVIQDAIERSGMTDSIMIVHLDQLFRSEVYQDVHRHGAFAYEKANAYRLDTFTLDKQKQLIGRELTSAKLAIRAIESIDFLTQRLDQVLSGDLAQHQLCETDLTPVFYETIVKKKKGEDVNETILKPEYQVGYASLTTPVNYCVPGTMDIKQLDVILTLGIDLPNRNILKQLESKQPSIKVITWMDSPDCFRYATVVTVDDAEAIFCGIYSNLRLIPNSDQ